MTGVGNQSRELYFTAISKSLCILEHVHSNEFTAYRLELTKSDHEKQVAADAKLEKERLAKLEKLRKRQVYYHSSSLSSAKPANTT